MADSKLAITSDNQGDVARGMAYLAKYSVKDAAGKILRSKIHLKHLCPNPLNRGGVYTSGVRVKELYRQACDAGFMRSEFEHNLCGVLEFQGAVPDGQISLLEYHLR